MRSFALSIAKNVIILFTILHKHHFTALLVSIQILPLCSLELFDAVWLLDFLPSGLGRKKQKGSVTENATLQIELENRNAFKTINTETESEFSRQRSGSYSTHSVGIQSNLVVDRQDHLLTFALLAYRSRFTVRLSQPFFDGCERRTDGNLVRKLFGWTGTRTRRGVLRVASPSSADPAQLLVLFILRPVLIHKEWM